MTWIVKDSGCLHSIMLNLMNKLKKLYKLLPPLLARDIKERYAGSTFGVLWTILQPLLFILLFWLVFSKIIKIRIPSDTGDIPFIAFLLSGLLPWFAMQEGVTRGVSSIVEKGYIIKKVFYPYELFPLAAVLSSFMHHGIGFFVFLVVFFLYKGSILFFQIPLIIALLVCQLILTAGIALLLSALAVYLRDILHVIAVAFQAIFYLTTILYPITAVPEELKLIIYLNPFTMLIESYHNVILFYKYPEINHTLYLLIFTTAVFITGYFTFRKLKRGFVDVL